MRNQTRTSLRSVSTAEEPTLQFLTIHGHRRAYRIAGSGPAILMIHGVGDSSATWSTVHAKLAKRFTVIAPDLLGHGDSDKPRADYSLAAFANGMRDLLGALGIERVTIIGHSLGGGIAGQFAYQYPHFVERVVLVASGGVSTGVSPALAVGRVADGRRGTGCPAHPRGDDVTAAVRPRRQDGARLDPDRPRPARPAGSGRAAAGSGGPVGVLAHPARRGGRPRPVRHDARPELPDGIAFPSN